MIVFNTERETSNEFMENKKDMVYHFPPMSPLKERRCNGIDEREIKEQYHS